VKLWLLALPWALLAQHAVAACVFDTNLAPRQGAPAALVDDPGLPAPEIESLDITRGASGGATCDRLGFVTLGLRWPRGTRLDVGDLGFEYRLAAGQAPPGLVPAGVVAGPAGNGRKFEHVLAWNDDDEVRSQRLELSLEVRAVAPDGRRGQPLVVRIYAPAGR